MKIIPFKQHESIAYRTSLCLNLALAISFENEQLSTDKRMYWNHIQTQPQKR